MNKTLITIIVGGASALAGLVSGYFIAKKTLEGQYEAEYEKRINEEIARIREVNSEMREKKEKETKAKEVPYIVKPPKGFNHMHVSFVDSASKEDGSVIHTDGKSPEYQKNTEEYYAQFEHPLDDDEEEEEDPERMSGSDEDLQNVYDYWYERGEHGITVISLDEYRKLPPYLEFKTWHYFDGDAVLVDDTDMIVDDVVSSIGDRALELLGTEEAATLAEGDCDTVYVVNINSSLALEVVLMHHSYTDWAGVR